MELAEFYCYGTTPHEWKPWIVDYEIGFEGGIEMTTVKKVYCQRCLKKRDV